jgi:prephenate dehydratase
MKIAIQGALGSFHHIASQQFYGDGHEYICCDTFAGVFEALASRGADVGVVAIENSLCGSITEVYDLLLRHNYPIVGEVAEHIHQNLITFPGAKLGDITRVYSHPVALAQCAEFLESKLPRVEIIEHHDTAGAVEYIKDHDEHGSAAIASTLAARMHGMNVLCPSIQDERSNFTRFLCIQPNGSLPPDADKASLVLTTSHQPGALYKALGVFADLDCNLTKLESRPIRGKVWHYQFYIDVEVTKLTLAEAIKQLESQGCIVKNLGMYRASYKDFDD